MISNNPNARTNDVKSACLVFNRPEALFFVTLIMTGEHTESHKAAKGHISGLFDAIISPPCRLPLIQLAKYV